jgi:hypothetical protein
VTEPLGLLFLLQEFQLEAGTIEIQESIQFLLGLQRDSQVAYRKGVM